MIYLDSAATTLLKPRGVHAAVSKAMRYLASPGRGGHRAAMAAARTLYECRETAAELFNMENPENIAVTFNATHALNIAIRDLVPENGRVITSGYEHNAVMRPLHALSADVTVIDTPPFDGPAMVAAFEEALKSAPDAAVFTHVSNVFGYVLPIEELAALCRRAGVPFIIDASQSAGALTVDFSALGADHIAMPGHKGLYGPQGTGLLLCKKTPSPLLFGGTGTDSARPVMPEYMPDAAEAGTHNMPGIAGLNAGMKFVLHRGTDLIGEQERLITAYIAEKLSDVGGVTCYSGKDGTGSGVISFNIDGIQPESTAQMLDREGIAVRAGLHCAPAAHKTAKTFPAGTVRMSACAFTTLRDAETAVQAIKRICAQDKNI